jgi:beta-lactamase regulating signal transducer with metallopeptidase domain
MTLGQFLIQWMVRSAILTVAGALLLRVFRVRNASFRSATWTAVLCASVTIPILSSVLPDVPLAIPRREPAFLREMTVAVPAPKSATVSLPGRLSPMEYDGPGQSSPSLSVVQHFDLSKLVIALYALVGAILLLRIGVGLFIAARLRRRSIATNLEDVRESNAVSAPVTLGIVRPAIVLPLDWREWDRARLDAVLAHESAHVERWDPAVELFSAIHRALLWASPLSWFLHARIVQTAEEASDDAAVKVCDRVRYAEILLGFMKREVRRPLQAGLPMARYGNPEKRLLRILDQPSISSGLTKRAAVAIVGVSLPVTCLIAATKAQFAPRLDEVRSRPSPPFVVVQEGRIERNPIERNPIERSKMRHGAIAPMLAQVVPQTPAPVNAATGPAEVRLTVTVTEPAGRYVTGLTAKDFRVTTGQISPDISSFGLTTAENSIVVLNTIGGGDDAVNALRKVLDSRDELTVLTGSPASDADMFWDAVVGAINRAKEMTNPYRSVVVMMRGASELPMGREGDLARTIRAALHSPRVAVSFASVEDITKPFDKDSHQDDLRIVAGATGGQVVPTPSVEEIPTSVTRIGLGLMNQYVLGFTPRNAPLGAFGRPPAVEVLNPRGLPPLRVIGPGGYFVEQ